MSRLFAFCALAAILVTSTGAVALDLLPARVSEVIDGDTIRVWLDGNEEAVRYLAIEAPELDEPGGYESRKVHELLLTGGRVWLECRREDGDALWRDGRGRLLAYVFADAEGKLCLNTELVKRGAARVGVRDVRDDTPADDFALKYLTELIAAQLEAARQRAGWWGKGDPHARSDLIVCFVKFWGKDEIAWLLNRGDNALELTAGWTLSDDGAKNEVEVGQRVPMDRLALPPGAVCRIHSGPSARGTQIDDPNQGIDLLWKRPRVWNNTGDRAILRDARGSVVYSYLYRATGN